MRLRPRITSALTFFFLALSCVSANAKEPISTSFLGRLAVGGYDSVAYFTQAKPVKGSKAHVVEYGGATFRFSSAENKAAFAANPEKYQPEYGGYCAWAVSQGYTAKSDPQQWKIVDGKLYLNYSAKVKKDWEQDIPGNIEKADRNWPAVLE